MRCTTKDVPITTSSVVKCPCCEKVLGFNGFGGYVLYSCKCGYNKKVEVEK